MATTYPSSYPCALIAGFSMQARSGVIRSDMPARQAQRRVFNTMPHNISLAFAMDVSTWASWQKWALANAYGWFTINLPSMYSGLAGTQTAPTLIRFTSELSVSQIAKQEVRISVRAEMAPSMIGRYLENT